MADQQPALNPQPSTQTTTAQPAPEETPSILAAAIKATESRLPEVQKFELHQRQARLFALSGLFADIKGQSLEQALAQAFVKIDLGESMGLSSAEAMTGIDLIQGRVAISANIRASRMQRAGFNWDILQLDDKGCRLSLKYKGQQLFREEVDEKTGEVSKVPAVVSFGEQDAARAGLIGKENYKKNPRNMFFARAITNAQRWYAPGILSVNILSTEEAMDLSGDAGEVTAQTKQIIDQAPTKTDALKSVVHQRATKAKGATKTDPNAPDPTQAGTPVTTTQTKTDSTTGGSETATSPQTSKMDEIFKLLTWTADRQAQWCKANANLSADEQVAKLEKILDEDQPKGTKTEPVAESKQEQPQVDEGWV